MNEKVRILLVDDEINAVKALGRVLVREGYELQYSTNPGEAMAMLDHNRFDIIICDQKMPGISGIDILEYSKKVFPETIRILITGYPDFQVMEAAINRCRVHCFFRKPWDNRKLLGMLKQVLNDRQTRYVGEEDNTDVISLKKDGCTVFLKTSEIYYLASEKGKVAIVTKNEKYFSWDPLKSWEDRLMKFGFIRCHRSFLVNVHKIKAITPWFKGTYNLGFADISDQIHSSRAYVKQLKKLMESRMDLESLYTNEMFC